MNTNFSFIPIKLLISYGEIKHVDHLLHIHKKRIQKKREEESSLLHQEKNGLQLTHVECDVGVRLVCHNPPVGQRVQHPFQTLHMLLGISETNLYRMNGE